MGLEHEGARSARPERRRHLIRTGAALTVVGGAVAGLLLAPGRTPSRAHAAEPEACIMPRPPEQAWQRTPALQPPAAQPETGPVVTARGRIPGGALAAEATLGQAKVVRGSDGELYLHVAVDALESTKRTDQRPIDFALVLDTSGSMEEEGKIEVLKRATKDLLAKLGPRDRVAIVAFSNDARTVFPLEAVGDEAHRLAYSEAIAKLEPRGGTNISAGLLAGADELRKCDPRKGSVRRIVLMTDGLATFGERKPDELCRLTNALAHEGFTVSTIGLGLEYGEKLLTDMADSGGGAFYGADKGDRLARIYEIEVDAARALVAHDARLILSPEAGVTVESVLVWPASDGPSGEKVVALGDLSAGRHLKAVARLRVPTSSSDALPVVRVALRYQDVRAAKAESVATESVALGVELVKDESLAASSAAPKAIVDELDQVAVADDMRRMHAAALDGNEHEVCAALAAMKTRLRGREELCWRDADGRENKVAFATVAAVASNVARAKGADLEESDNRAMKAFNSGVQALGK